MSYLSILINGEVAFEFNRDIDFEENQLEFLDRMDSDMGKGIKVHGVLQEKPDARQRAHFVVMNLIKALRQENDAIIQASSAYLVNRFPELSEIHVSDDVDTIKIEFIEDESEEE